MNIKDYVKILGKNLWLIVVVLVVFIGVVAAFSAKKPASFQASSTIEVIRSQNKDAQNFYQFDNYYSGLAANSLSDNMMGWLASPSTVSEVFSKAGYPMPEGDLKALGKVFTSKKRLAASAVVEISYASGDRQKAQGVVKQASTVLSDRIDEYNKADGNAVFNAIVSEPVVIQEPKAYALNLLIAGFLGLFIGLSLAFLRESLRK